MSVAAWVLELGAKRCAAVGWADQVLLLSAPETAVVPSAPAHCRYVVFLGERCVPVFDAVAWFDGHRAEGYAGLCIGVYQYSPHSHAEPELGAIWLDEPPRRVEVDDSMSVALPVGEASRWAPIAHACFDDGSGPVPVLALGALFSSDTA